MGSLVGGWDSNAPGVPPKGWLDYEEPCSPRGRALCRETSTKAGELSRQLSRQLSSPPSLNRASAPVPVGRQQSLPRSLTIGKPSLIRTSTVGSPSSPRSPRAGECTSYTPRTPRDTLTPRMASSLDSSTAFIIRYHELAEGDAVDLRSKERWCDRLDSHVLNERPDEGNELAWRHGTFKSQADIGVQHLAEDPCTCAEQGGQPEPQVGRVRAPQQAQQPQQDSLGDVRTPQGLARGNGREISPSP